MRSSHYDPYEHQHDPLGRTVRYLYQQLSPAQADFLETALLGYEPSSGDGVFRATLEVLYGMGLIHNKPGSWHVTITALGALVVEVVRAERKASER